MSTNHDAKREVDAAFFEDWTQWSFVVPEIEQQRFRILGISGRPSEVLVGAIPGSQIEFIGRYHTINSTTWFLPAGQWRALRKVLPMVLAYKQRDEKTAEDRRARELAKHAALMKTEFGITISETRDDGRHRTALWS